MVFFFQAWYSSPRFSFSAPETRLSLIVTR
jgi:hypothetical protein